MTWLLQLPIRHPRTTIGLIVALTLALAPFAARVRVDSAIENLLPSHDAERLYYEEVVDTFGSEEATVVGIFADDVFAPETLARIDLLSRALAEIDAVREVLSLTTMKGVESNEFGVEVGRLMRELPTDAASAAAFRERVYENPLAVGNMVSSDGKTTGALVLFDDLSDEEFLSLGIEDRIRVAAEQVFEPEELAITGLQTLKVTGARLMEQDLARFMPLSILLVVFVLAWAFRTKRGVLLPLAAVTIGLVWTIGLMVLAGRSINMGTLVLPPLLMAVGIAYVIHVVSRYYQELRPGRPRAEIVETTMEHVRVPVGVAALTTGLGFCTLALNPIRAIADLGIFAVLGILAISFTTLAFLPSMLMILPDAAGPPKHHDRWITGMLGALGRLAIDHRRVILLGGVILCGLSIYAAADIRVETNYVGFFDPESSIRRDTDRLAEAIGGAYPLYVVVDGQGPGAMRDLENLAAIRDLQSFIDDQPGVDSTLSFPDFIELINGVFDPESKGRLPLSQGALEQLFLFVNPEDTKPVVNKDYSRANILVRTRLSGSSEVSTLVAEIERYAQTRLRRGVEAHATGTVVLLNRSADTLARGQVSGLAQMLTVLLVLMSLLFLSLRTGLLALVPNVIPILILFGAMGLTGIDLNISTSMIAVIAIGIAVDDTIHYLSALNVELRRTGSQERALLLVGRSVGQPIVFTTIALALGFLVVTLSNFRPIRDFGFLASLTMVAALFTDLLLVPALVMSTRIITLWDLLFVKLGPEPHKEIPLFAGLRPFQARIVVLMAHLEQARPGTYITRKGELKGELYVLLSGQADVYIDPDRGSIREMGRGEVIGEMGLVRNMPRSADVVTSQPSEYLVLDEEFLNRIQRRYPRIASKVFLNLTRILSDRLETSTEKRS